MYSVRGRNAATAATADHAIWGFWNPHSTHRIKVISISQFAQSAAPAAGFSCRLRRITTQGTPGSSITPGISAHSQRGIAPPSGVILGLASYAGAQPTLDTNDFGIGFVFANQQGSGLVYPFPGGIEIGPGAGIAMIQVAATASVQFDITVSWLEDWL